MWGESSQECELDCQCSGFYRKYKMPGLLGCIDGTHIAIVCPVLHEERFFNRKGYHSLNVLIICDSDLNILCVDASYPGSTHDSVIWANHPLNSYLERLHTISGEDVYFLGDSGYPLRPTLMIPETNPAPGTPDEHYQDLHLTARSVVERCIGVLKARFRLITDSFKINSGNSGTKRRRDEAMSQNYKFKMNPHSLDFSPLSPIHNSPVITPKRRVFGEIQNLNSPRLKSPLIENVLKNSPLTSRTVNSPMKSFNSPAKSLNSPLSSLNSPKMNKPFIKRSSTKISRIFEERSRFKKTSNKENEINQIENETFIKFDMEESFSFNRLDEPCSSFEKDAPFSNLDKIDSNEMQDSPVSRVLQKSRTIKNWSIIQMDSETPERNFPIQKTDQFAPELAPEMEDYESLHDLEDFDNDNFDQCNKYEIISTDSPDIITRGRCDTRKINAKNFAFGAPIGESEPSTSFNKPNVNATRMLNFSDFEFTSPLNTKKVAQITTSVKKSLKFSETPTKNALRHESSNSSIGSMSMSPISTKLRLFPSESTTSMESGFISEMDEPFLELEEPSSSPKMANFSELLSKPIKSLESEFVLKRPTLQRSLSFNPEATRARTVLFNQSPFKKSNKRLEPLDEAVASTSKKRRVFEVPEITQRPRPTLQRAFSENAASIMSALAKSASEPDLIGDFSQPCALPLLRGNHSDLKSISCDTLAALIRGEYEDCISDFQVIDCRYPYEFEGGHIDGAANIYSQDQVLKFISEAPPETEGRRVLIFHCEYSLERGPKLSRFLRSSDRAKNKENYPSLHYPEVYLLHEGYRAFYLKYPKLCTAGYRMMLDPQYKSELVKFRRNNSKGSMF